MRKSQSLTLLLVIVSLLLATTPGSAAKVQQSQRSGTILSTSFLYMLSGFSGTVASQWARVAFEPQRDEVYTLTQGFNTIRIFNRHGMETYAFGDDGSVVSAVDLAPAPDGTIYLLARDFRQHGIQVLNYRGQPIGNLRPKDLPESFHPERLELHQGHFYLLDPQRHQLIILDSAGNQLKYFDLSTQITGLAEELNPEKQQSLGADINGFAVGPNGAIYLTVPTLFSALRVSADGSVAFFGTSGSGPGKFGVVSGITADELGNIYVADRLRSVVLIFDSNFTFLGEFGYRGSRPQDMLVPDDLSLDLKEHRLFVSQAANKGVGVYKISLQKQTDWTLPVERPAN